MSDNQTDQPGTSTPINVNGREAKALDGALEAVARLRPEEVEAVARAQRIAMCPALVRAKNLTDLSQERLAPSVKTHIQIILEITADSDIFDTFPAVDFLRACRILAQDFTQDDGRAFFGLLGNFVAGILTGEAKIPVDTLPQQGFSIGEAQAFLSIWYALIVATQQYLSKGRHAITPSGMMLPKQMAMEKAKTLMSFFTQKMLELGCLLDGLRYAR